MLAMRDLMELASLDYPHLREAPHQPVDHPQLLSPRSIFHIIRDAGSNPAAASVSILQHLG